MLKKINYLKDLTDSLPIIERIVFHIANSYGQKDRFTIKMYGPDAKEVSLLWGAFQFRTGAQIHIELVCTQRAMAVINKSLVKNAVTFQSKIYEKQL